MDTNGKTWTESRKACQSIAPENMIGDLVSIHNKETNEFLTTLTSKRAWIGGSDADSEGDWTWSDGTPWDSEYWIDGAPYNNSLNMNNTWDYAFMNYNDLGSWYDETEDFASVVDFICQYKSG